MLVFHHLYMYFNRRNYRILVASYYLKDCLFRILLYKTVNSFYNLLLFRGGCYTLVTLK